MTVIRPRLLELLRDTIVLAVVAAKVKIDGELRNYAIKYTDIVGDTIRLYVYIADVQGTITEAVLVDNVGAELAGDAIHVIKGDDGFTIVFEFILRGEVN